MKKMPTLFKREYLEKGGRRILNEVTPGCEWVLEGEGIATVKFDGTCCMVKDGKLYARFDMKPGRKLPGGAIPCQESADPVTGHFPHWVPVEEHKTNYKWHWTAYQKSGVLPDGTYELCGPHFQGNPEKLAEDTFILHGSIVLPDVPRSFDGLKDYLEKHCIEGIVFHNGDKMCKIKRKDFGFKWK